MSSFSGLPLVCYRISVAPFNSKGTQFRPVVIDSTCVTERTARG